MTGSGWYNMKRMLAGLALLVGVAPAWAGGLDLALSNDTVNLSIVLNHDPFNITQNQARDGGAEVAVGGFINEIGDNLLHATVMARGIRQSAASQHQFSAGVKLIGGEIKNDKARAQMTDTETVGALALGFQAGLLLRQSPYNPIELSFEGFYAPSITSFSDAERYSEVTARLQIEVMPRARAYVGYRRLHFDTNDYEDLRLDRSAHFGISISF